MWSKKDSENLASIALSLEKLAEREFERQLMEDTKSSFIGKLKQKIVERPIKVTEGPSLQEEALEEDIKTTQRIQNKVVEAYRNGNSPFFAEALLDEEELETL